MEGLLYIAAIIAIIAFVVLVIVFVLTYKVIKRASANISGTLEGLEQQMKGITTETTALLNKTNKLADDVNQKSSKLDGLFDGAKGIGNTMQDFNQSLRQLSSSIIHNASENQDKASQAVKWGAALIDLWKKKNK